MKNALNYCHDTTFVPSTKRIKILNSTLDESETSKSISSLPDDVLGDIFSLVGDGHYRFIAGVSRSFRTVYQSLFQKRITYYSVCNAKCAKLCYRELKSKTGKIHLIYVAARAGKLDIVSLLRFLDCPWDDWTSAVAAKLRVVRGYDPLFVTKVCEQCLQYTIPPLPLGLLLVLLLVLVLVLVH